MQLSATSIDLYSCTWLLCRLLRDSILFVHLALCLCDCVQAALGKVGNLDRMFEVFEDARGDDKWNRMNLRQRAEHLNIRCINAVLACIRHNQLGYVSAPSQT